MELAAWFTGLACILFGLFALCALFIIFTSEGNEG